MVMCSNMDSKLERLQQRLEYRFSDVALLRQAMVHRSYLNEVTTRNLSRTNGWSLGDAILGAVVAHRLYTEFIDMGEGWMTVARSQLVRNETLGRIGRELGLGECLLMGAGIANDGARERLSVLSRALEATFGAVWLDGGERAARAVILGLLENSINALNTDAVQADAKSLLQHLTQSRDGSKPTYLIIGESVPPHDRSFRASVEVEGEPLAEGCGRSKQSAEMDAARKALAALEEPGA